MKISLHLTIILESSLKEYLNELFCYKKSLKIYLYRRYMLPVMLHKKHQHFVLNTVLIRSGFLLRIAKLDSLLTQIPLQYHHIKRGNFMQNFKKRMDRKELSSEILFEKFSVLSQHFQKKKNQKKKLPIRWICENTLIL